MSSTSICCLHNGCVPVFSDVSKTSFNIDAESIRKVITPRTKAIITVALYGLCPDYDPILELCKEHNVRPLASALPSKLLVTFQSAPDLYIHA